jgi:thiol:disulfide interchange protein
MPRPKPQKQAESSMRRALGTAWDHREPVMWAAIVVLGLTVQWPVLKGWYYSATATVAPASAVAWRSDLAAALAEARAAHKGVFVDFSASWCPPCIAMKHEVWPNAEVARAINAGYVPVAVDADQNNGLSDRYQVENIPTVLILDADGRVVKRNEGYLPRAGVMRFLAEAAQ